MATQTRWIILITIVSIIGLKIYVTPFFYNNIKQTWTLLRGPIDVSPYLGKIVCIKSDNYYFTLGKDQVFGLMGPRPYEWARTNESGPGCTRFLSPKSGGGNCAFITERYNIYGKVYLRLATKTEKETLAYQIEYGILEPEMLTGSKWYYIWKLLGNPHLYWNLDGTLKKSINKH
jgi:hypothetical protein